MGIFDSEPNDFFKTLIVDNVNQISFLRAIDEEFKINIWELLPEIE